MERMGFIITQAPDEVKPVLVKIKTDQDKAANMKNLSNTSLNTEVLSKTLAFLMNCEEKDERITKLVRKGKQMMIMKLLVNLMPEQCNTCMKENKKKIDPCEKTTQGKV